MAAPARLLALLAVPAALVAGCGQTQKNSASDFQGPQKAVAQTVEDLQSAGRKRDGNKICEQLLAPALVQQIQRASKGTCASVLDDRLRDVDAFEMQVQKVTISGDRATAVVHSDAGKHDRTDTFGLVRQGASWKLASLGGR